MKKFVLVACGLLVAVMDMGGRNTESSQLTGPYLGQKPPGELPEAFAPSVIFSKNAVHGYIALTPDGGEIYWIFLPPDPKNPPAINVIKQVNGHWAKPGIMEFTREYGVGSLFLSPDGRQLFFTSKRPWPDSWGKQPSGNQLEAWKIWYVERAGAGWGEPKPLDRRINQNIMGVSSTLDGTLYTDGIKRTKRKNGQYAEWEQLGHPLDVGKILGGHPYVSPDESYVLFNRKWPGKFGYGIFVSYRTKDDRWTEPVNLLEKLGASRGGSQPIVTPDGKYLFCYSGGKFLWMDAKIIGDLKPKRLK